MLTRLCIGREGTTSGRKKMGVGGHTDADGEDEETSAGEDVLYQVRLPSADESGGLPVVFCIVGGSREAERWRVSRCRGVLGELGRRR